LHEGGGGGVKKGRKKKTVYCCPVEEGRDFFKIEDGTSEPKSTRFTVGGEKKGDWTIGGGDPRSGRHLCMEIRSIKNIGVYQKCLTHLLIRSTTQRRRSHKRGNGEVV